MRFSKAIKRIAVLGTGAAMLGATVLGALAAADLSQYPAPFVQNGNFNGVIVVGSNAQTADVVGAIDVAASLQYAMKKTEMTGCGGSEVTINEGVKIQGTGSEVLNYGEKLDDVRTTPLDVDDLPNILADGTYYDNKGTNENEVTYTQTLTLDDNGEVGYGQPDNNLDANTYLTITKDPVYEYKLEFDDPVEHDGTPDDLKTTKLDIQGNEYTITGVKMTDDQQIKELDLMAGDTVMWLTQDQPITRIVDGTEHTIQVVDVTDNEDSCGVSVDGQTAWIDVGSKETINGVEIGVTDAKAVHSQLQDMDVCELNVGASEIKLIDNDYVNVNGKDIKKAKTTFDQTANKWNGFTITYTPDEKQYLKENESLIDPVFGNFKISMAGETSDRETYELSASGDDGDFTFLNNEGKKVDLPLYHSSTNTKSYWGTDDNEFMLVTGDMLTFNDVGASSADYSDFEGTKLLAVTSGRTAHLLEIDNVDTTDNKITLKDLTYDRTFESDFDWTSTAAQPIDLGSLGQITLQLIDSNKDGDLNDLSDGIYAYDLGDNMNIETNYGADLVIGSVFRPEKSEISIQSSATQDGSVTVTLDGSGHDVAVSNGDTPKIVAQKIADAVNGLEGYIATVDDTFPTVTITATEAGDQIDTAYDDGGTGATGIVDTLQDGEAGIPDKNDAGSGDAVTVAELTEEDIDDSGITPAVIDLGAVYDSGSDDTLEVYKTGITAASIFDDNFEKTVDSKTKMTSTQHGTLVEWNTDTNDYVDIMYPKKEVEVNVFVAPVSAEVTTAGGNVETTTINKINVGAAKLDSEVIGDVDTTNMIVVGGPCINTVAAKLLTGNTAPVCGADFTNMTGVGPGEAIIKLFDNGQRVAMLVAGYEALQSRMATTVVADYDKYNLSGTEVKVTGTGLTDINVETVQ